jgi:hypothetical protein
MKRVYLVACMLVVAFGSQATAEEERKAGEGGLRAGSAGGRGVQRSPQRAPEARPRQHGRPSRQSPIRPLQAAPQGARAVRATKAQATRPQVIPGKQTAQVAGNERLKGTGAKIPPHRFASKSQILVADRSQSSISYPKQGFNGKAVSGHAIGSKEFNDPVVRNHMALLGQGSSGFSRAQIRGEMSHENARGKYYWHHNAGFDYCHFNDSFGFSWYGWYVGDSYFWTRYYGDRWWFYDDGAGRWNYWSAGEWWWQDPNNLDVEYSYDDGSYIPVALGPAPVAGRSYLSDDGTCLIRIQGADEDAYLMDTRKPPVYEPLLLEKGVKRLKFYEPEDNGAIQIMLTLQDGSIRVYDDQGNPLNFSEKDAEEEDDSAEAESPKALPGK